MSSFDEIKYIEVFFYCVGRLSNFLGIKMLEDKGFSYLLVEEDHIGAVRSNRTKLR